MLRSEKDLRRCSIYATGGEDVGDVETLFFDDGSWKVHYLVAKTGGLLLTRQVLISPNFVGEMDREAGVLYAELTKEQIEDAPGVEADRPVAEQQEVAYYDYYKASLYWGSGWEAAGPAAAVLAYARGYAFGTEAVPKLAGEGFDREKRGDPHLRSTREVAGYRIGTTDGEIGHVEDFVVDDEDWYTRYIVVGTRNWLPGKKVLISSRWVLGVSWNRTEVYADLEGADLISAPGWDSDAPLDQEYEIRPHEHYGRTPYWVYR